MSKLGEGAVWLPYGMGFELDHRGLVPLDEARQLVAGSVAFRRGEGRMIDDRWVWDSDRLWAALTSLHDAAEFMTQARRLIWRFHPRRDAMLAPIARHGAAIAPWLCEFVSDGVLINVPWCVAPCLIACAAPVAFEAIWSIRVVDDLGTSARFPGPFSPDGLGDVDAEGPVEHAVVPERPNQDANQLVLSWIDAHPKLAFPELVRRGFAGERRAWVAILALSNSDPGWVESHLRAAVGDEASERAMLEVKNLKPR